MKILQIVPRLKPAVDGVGDYALVLAKALLEQHSIETIFIVCDPLWPGSEYVDGFQVIQLKARSGNCFFDCFNEIVQKHKISKIFLQYVGYGYEKRGCPFWLVQGLEKVKKCGQIKTVTMFHEVHASSWRPWTSSFWNQLVQRWITRKIACLSFKIATNTERYFQMLKKIGARSDASEPVVMPVLSSVGEFLSREVRVSRAGIAVVFGCERKKSYQKINQIVPFFKKMNIAMIYDVGPSGVVNLENLEIPVKFCGVLAIEEIAELFSRALVGLVVADPVRLGKSSVFAAYAAFGVVPIVVTDVQGESEGLKEGQHFLNIQNLNKTRLIDLQKISEEIMAWYQLHSYKKQADFFANSFKG